MNSIDQAYLLYAQALKQYLDLLEKLWEAKEANMATLRLKKATEHAWMRFERRYKKFTN